ncbi:MAG: hypothetical protein BZY88_18460 [SAR202 cluster bacterium Io17-Chloro-G9]|nr:MAG: hypothetical protein BZY88_18460 [SAR202 cluster bacterium Io17-Chloro-G9]
MNTVAVLSPGDMGHAVGQLLREHEVRVVTCLAGRSGRTKALSEKAGIIALPTMEEMVSQSDVILSITVSEAVPDLCRMLADAMIATGAKPLFGECNAVAPQLARRMEPIITAAGGRFVDASIIGGPPRNGSSPRFYASGHHAAEFEGLREFGLDVRNIGPDIGQASGIKMCYAAMTKGSSALYTQLLVAAEAMGLLEPLKAEFQDGQAQVLERMERSISGLPARSRRWVSEMQEISAAFQHLGLTPFLFQGVSEMYRYIGGTPLGEETPEARNSGRDMDETVRQLAAYLEPPQE